MSTSKDNTEKITENNLKLWNENSVSNVSSTKRVSGAGRGQFTAIDAYSQIYEATKQWGPYGSTWKLEDIKSQIIEDNGTPLAMISWFNFVYPGGSFHVSSDITFSRKAQKGDFSNLNDSSKKIRTDALTKALSYLGFNADIFLGKFDDNKYVEMLIEKEKIANSELVTQKKRSAIEDYQHFIENVYYPGLKECKSMEQLKSFINQHKQKFQLLKTEDGKEFKSLLDQVVKAMENRKYQLEETDPSEDNVE